MEALFFSCKRLFHKVCNHLTECNCSRPVGKLLHNHWGSRGSEEASCCFHSRPGAARLLQTVQTKGAILYSADLEQAVRPAGRRHLMAQLILHRGLKLANLIKGSL